jgi:hypothetical protein
MPHTREDNIFLLPLAVFVGGLLLIGLFALVVHARSTFSLVTDDWTCQKTAPFKHFLSAKRARREGREYYIVQKCVLYRMKGQ